MLPSWASQLLSRGQVTIVGYFRLWILLLTGVGTITFCGNARAASSCRPDVRKDATYSLNRARSLHEENANILVGSRKIPAIGASLAEIYSIQNYQAQTAKRYWKTYTAGDAIVGVELGNIKSLNEKVLGISKTEKYIEAVNIRLHQRLQSQYSRWGVVFSNFKRTYVWFPSSLRTFQDNVLDPVIAKLIVDLKSLDTLSGEPFDWATFLKNNITISIARTKPMAALNLSAGNSTRIPNSALASPAAFSKFAATTRHILASAMVKRGLDIDHLLLELRKATSSPSGLPRFREWLDSLRMGHRFDLAMTYLDVLRSAEYLPHAEASQIPTSLDSFIGYRQENTFGRWRGNWYLERRVFKEISNKAKYVFITDVRNLGYIGLKALDRWVLSGANLKTLEATFDTTTKAMESRLLEIKQYLIKHLSRHGLSKWR